MRIARWGMFVLVVLVLTGCPKKSGYLRAATLEVLRHP